jgi:AcrR family transcriptional regulator
MVTLGAIDASGDDGTFARAGGQRPDAARPHAARPDVARPDVARPDVRAVNPTRQRVLTAALVLFNDRGTAHVTTNHIAAAAGLSPGNLYYWFRNKQQVIRALVEQWLAEIDGHVDELLDQPAHVHALWDDLGRTADSERRFSFVRREVLALLHDDAELAAAYRAGYRRWLDAHVEYVHRLVRAGVLEMPAPRTAEDLAVALWLVTEYWPSHLALLLDDDARGPRPTGIRPMLVVLSPYLTEQGVRALEIL